MEKALKKVLQYFAFFDYLPTFEEIYTFFPEKISQNNLKKLLRTQKYTLPEYSKMSSKRKNQISKRKLNSWKFKIYVKILTVFPQIKLVGLSGSISMMNAGIDDDIDLFIITKRNRLFTARFIASIIAFIMGLKRDIGLQKAPNKVCLNLFFDESDLSVPSNKKTEFVAHEILQMKPLINKDDVYQKFLQANEWVFRLFPNASRFVIARNKDRHTSLTMTNERKSLIENLLKEFQLFLIRRHKTTEIITSTQLWFHPADFGKKIKNT